MMELILLGIVFAVFALSFGMIRLLERLG